MKLLRTLAAALAAAALLGLGAPARAQQNPLFLSTTDPGAPGNQFLGAGGIADILNKAIQAVGSSNEGPNAPTNALGGAPFAYQDWINTTASPPQREIYDGAAWIVLATINSSTHVVTLAAATLPAPTSSSLGGVESIAAVTHQWINAISTAGVPSLSRPAASDLSNGVTGSGAVVLATSPILVTPTLGAASATSINNVAITAPASAATLTIANGKTLTVSNSITLSGTDGTAFGLPGASDTLAGLAASQVFAGVDTFATLQVQGSGAGVTTIASANASATNYTLTAPAITDTIVTQTATQTLTNKSISAGQINSGTLPVARLPLATASAVGGIEGDGATLSITAGVISCVAATTSQKGCVSPDGTIITDSAGAITVAKASASAFGVVEGDGVTVTLSAGVLSLNLAAANVWTANQGIDLATESLFVTGNWTLQAADGNSAAAYISSAAGTSTLEMFRVDTTFAAPTKITAGQTIGSYRFGAYDGSAAVHGTALISAMATATWSHGTDTETKIVIEATPVGSTTLENEATFQGGVALGSLSTEGVGTINVASSGVYNNGTAPTGSGGGYVLASAPTMTNPVVGTQSPGNNSTLAASTAFVTAAVAASTTGVSSIAGNTGAFTLGPGLANATNILEGDATYEQGKLGGLTLANDATSPTTVVDSAAGDATSDDVTTLMKIAAFTKTTGAWAAGSGNGGLDVGTVGDNLWYYDYLIERTDTGNVDELLSLSPTTTITGSWTALILGASPSSFLWANHGAQPGSAFSCAGGTPPTGITNGVTYYVLSAALTYAAFEFATSQGGSAITTTGGGSGTGTCTFSPTLPSPYTKRRRIGEVKTNGGAQILPFVQHGDEFDWTTPVADVNAATLGTAQDILTLASIPPGIAVNALVTANINKASAPEAAAIIPYTETGTTGFATPVARYNLSMAAADENAVGEFNIPTIPGQQIVAYGQSAAITLSIITHGFIDTRGRFN